MPKHIFLKDHAYFITTNVKYNDPIFNDEKCCAFLIRDFNYYRNVLEFQIYGYVIMPNHFHWIIHPGKKATASLIMKKVKGHSSFVINEYLNQSGSLWQEDYHDHVIRNKLDFEEKINYIHKNPVSTGLVSNMENYKYSSYRNYFLGDESIIHIDRPLL